MNSIGGDEEDHAKSEHEKEEEEKKEEEFKDIARLDDLLLLFPGFDIPYLAKKEDWQIQFE